jgi:hypothetical protein
MGLALRVEFLFEVSAENLGLSLCSKCAIPLRVAMRFTFPKISKLDTSLGTI